MAPLMDAYDLLTDWTFWITLGAGMLLGQVILWAWDWLHPRWKLDTLGTCFLLTILLIVLLSLYGLTVGLSTPSLNR